MSLSLCLSLTGKKAFIAGVADDQGFGWAIAKALAEAGAEISLGVWVSLGGGVERANARANPPKRAPPPAPRSHLSPLSFSPPSL